MARFHSAMIRPTARNASLFPHNVPIVNCVSAIPAQRPSCKWPLSASHSWLANVEAITEPALAPLQAFVDGSLQIFKASPSFCLH